MALSQVVIFDTDNATQLGTSKPFPTTSSLTTSTLGNGATTTLSSTAVAINNAAANTGRKMLIIQNIGSATVRIGPSTVTAATGIQLPAGAMVVFQPPYIPTNAFFGIREGGTDSTVLCSEAN